MKHLHRSEPGRPPKLPDNTVLVLPELEKTPHSLVIRHRVDRLALN